MTYEWEDEIKANKIIESADLSMPNKFQVLGIVVANMESVEGALMLRSDFQDGSMAAADILKDAHGDATEHYQEAIDALFKDKN